MSARFAINTDFKLQIHNLSAAVHSKLSQHSKVRNIAQHSKESTKMEMTLLASEEFFGGGAAGGGGKEANWCPQEDTYRKTRFSSITRLELRSVERNDGV